MNDLATAEPILQSTTLSSTGFAVLSALAYAEVFSYPLSAPEIHQGMELEINDPEDLTNELKALCEQKYVYKYGDFYSLSSDPNCLKKRLERNSRAAKYLPWAKRISRFIGGFPFVKAVLLSGSISKNSMDNDSDIDYFIITEPGRLWVARTLLIAFKKLFLFNSYKFFCLNYFLDTDNLVVKDHNAYVAHEIASLIPTYGEENCKAFHNQNKWIIEYLPNHKLNYKDPVADPKKGFLKRIFEWVLNGRLGDAFERKCLAISESYWKKKFNKLNKEELKDISVSDKNVSKHHPDNFKKRILHRRQVILNDLAKKFELVLS